MYNNTLAANELFAMGKSYYVSIFTKNALPLFEDSQWCELLLNIFTYNKYALNYRVFGFVIMPTHLHIIIYPCKVPLPQIILKNTANYTRYYQMITSRQEPLWDKDYYSYQVSDYDCLEKIRDFIHMNPVRNKLTEHPGDYAYTSCRFYAGDT